MNRKYRVERNMNRKGFTLVELAIVLVIIGLLVGGVLQGQELIKQAQIRNTVQQLTSFDAAVNTFRAKYREMPGDITRANAFGVDVPKGGSGANVADTNAANDDGDGDGILESIVDATDGTRFDDFNGEIANFWVHLSNVNLVKGEYANDPSTAVQTVIQAFPESSVGVGSIAVTSGGVLYWVNGVSSTLSDLDAAEEGAGSLVGNGLTPEEAYGIDSKIDDGTPDNGIIQVISLWDELTGTLTDDTDVSGDATDCMGTGAEYQLANEVRSCTIRVRSSS